MQAEIARMRALAVVVTRQSPSLGLAFAAASDAIATECDALLREMMGWWSPQCSLASTARTAFLLLLRRLAGRERNMELAQIFGRPPPAISEMYNVMLDEVYEHARRAM
eukprot:scaffold240_cov369-Pavlova_lutheri.AAC.4